MDEKKKFKGMTALYDDYPLVENYNDHNFYRRLDILDVLSYCGEDDALNIDVSVIARDPNTGFIHYLTAHGCSCWSSDEYTEDMFKTFKNFEDWFMSGHDNKSAPGYLASLEQVKEAKKKLKELKS